MSFLKCALRQYSLHLLAIAVFGFAAICYRNQANRLAEEALADFAMAFVGLVSVIAAEEWSEWTWKPGMTRNSWSVTPVWLIRIIGAYLLVRYTVALYHLNTVGRPAIHFL